MIARLCAQSVTALLLVLFVGISIGWAQDPGPTDLDKIPQRVMNGLKARFPKAQIRQWTQEKEGELVIYDFEFTQDGRKFEADIKEDGSIYNWEVTRFSLRHATAIARVDPRAHSAASRERLRSHVQCRTVPSPFRWVARASPHATSRAA